MNSSTVSITEGKKSFSRLINDTIEKKEKIIVTRRGKPVAVIVPYQEYEQSARVDGYRQIMEAREVFLKDLAFFADKAFLYARLYGRSVYDSSYLALAEQQGIDFITADERLFNSVKKELPWVRWIGENL